MAAYFFDSSALVKRYVRETGTAWIANIIDAPSPNPIYLVRITGVEVIAAITRRARNAALSMADASVALSLFRYEFSNDFTVTEISTALITRAMELAEHHALRGYDAVQLAAALDVQAYFSTLSVSSLTLVSADVELNTAAMAEGLSVEDPNTHS
ncbi:MAG: type II toxin-antitoxin system VapC family toxin [Blastocatellia bacterium]